MHKANLLPPAARQRFGQKRTAILWSKLLAVSVSMALLTIAWGQSTAATYNAKTEHQLSLMQRPTEVRQSHQNLKAQLRSLNEIETEQMEHRSRFSPLVIVQLLHQLKEEFNGELQANSIDFAEQNQSANVPQGTTNGFVTLQLVTHGTTNCSDLIQRIRDTGLFTDVKLSSSLELVDANSDALRFTLRCEF